MSCCSVCTLGELENAVHWMSASRTDDITARVVYLRHGRDGYARIDRATFERGGEIPAGVHVLVEMNKPGYRARQVSRYRVIEAAPMFDAELQSLGDCPATEWVMIYRFALQDAGPSHQEEQ